jgi:hypothetical protein
MIMERALRKKHNLPESFAFYRWECMPRAARETIYFQLEGGECVPLKSGKNKGRPNYAKATNRRAFVVTVAEAEQMDADYHAETGNCIKCMGSGRQVQSISVERGTTYHTCVRCSGIGKA